MTGGPASELDGWLAVGGDADALATGSQSKHVHFVSIATALGYSVLVGLRRALQYFSCCCYANSASQGEG